jgi:E3 ubiquitin-protein ligase TRIP12
VRCIHRIIDWAQKLPQEDFHSIVTKSLVQVILNVSQPLVTQTNPSQASIFTTLIKIIGQIAKTSDSLAAALVSDLNVLPLILTILSGGNSQGTPEELRSSVMSNIVKLQAEQTLATISVASDILPKLPEGDLWKFEIPINDLDSDKRYRMETPPRLVTLQEKINVTDKYFRSIVPVLIDVFGFTVNPQIRRACLECVAKVIWFLDKESLLSGDYAFTSKFISDLMGLSQNFLSRSEEDKEGNELKSFVAAGLQLADILLHRGSSVFEQYLVREGVFDEMKKLVKELEGNCSNPKMTEDDKGRPGLAVMENEPESHSQMEDVLRNIVDDLNKIEENLKGGNQDRTCREEQPTTSILLDDMKSAFATLRQERERQSPRQSEKKVIKSLSGQLYDHKQVNLWMIWICAQMTASMENKDNSSNEELMAVREVLSGNAGFDFQDGILEKFANLLVESHSGSGLTGFELVNSGLVSSLHTFLSKSLDLVDNKSFPSLNHRLSLFYRVFFNGPQVTDTPLSFIENALPRLVSRLQDALSRSECLKVALAIPQSSSLGSTPSMISLLSALTGSNGTNVKEISSPSLQLARQIRLKLVADESDTSFPANFQAIVVSIHAVATFKALEEYIRTRLLIRAQFSSGSETGLDDDWDDDEEDLMDFEEYTDEQV